MEQENKLLNNQVEILSLKQEIALLVKDNQEREARRESQIRELIYALKFLNESHQNTSEYVQKLAEKI